MSKITFVATVDGHSVRQRDVFGAASEITLRIVKFVDGRLVEGGKDRRHVQVTRSRFADGAAWAAVVAAAEKICGRDRGFISTERFQLSGDSYFYQGTKMGVHKIRRSV